MTISCQLFTWDGPGPGASPPCTLPGGLYLPPQLRPQPPAPRGLSTPRSPERVGTGGLQTRANPRPQLPGPASPRAPGPVHQATCSLPGTTGPSELQAVCLLDIRRQRDGQGGLCWDAGSPPQPPRTSTEAEAQSDPAPPCPAPRLQRSAPPTQPTAPAWPCDAAGCIPGLGERQVTPASLCYLSSVGPHCALPGPSPGRLACSLFPAPKVRHFITKHWPSPEASGSTPGPRTEWRVKHAPALVQSSLAYGPPDGYCVQLCFLHSQLRGLQGCCPAL